MSNQIEESSPSLGCRSAIPFRHGKSIQPIAIFVLSLVIAANAFAVNWSKQFPHELKSRYFVFHHQRASWPAPEFARFADAFVDLVNRDFVEVKYDYPIEVLVLATRGDFHEFLRKKFAMSEPPNFGIYFRGWKVFVTYEDSGFGTFAHEIMHPLVDRNLADCPVWATEGIPAFFEKFIGYWDGNELVAHWGYQNPWRIEAIGDKLPKLDLKRILADRRPVTSFNNSERRLLTVFLWQQGKLERFMRLIASRDRAGRGSYFEAALDKPLTEIIPIWQTYLAEIAAHREDIMRIPGSVVLQDRAVFERATTGYTPWRQTRVVE